MATGSVLIFHCIHLRVYINSTFMYISSFEMIDCLHYYSKLINDGFNIYQLSWRITFCKRFYRKVKEITFVYLNICIITLSYNRIFLILKMSYHSFVHTNLKVFLLQKKELLFFPNLWVYEFPVLTSLWDKR